MQFNEIEALKELIKRQKNKEIVIKPCDKGAGMIILDYPTYMKSCYEHLMSEKVMDNGESKRYYVQVEK